LNILVVGTGYVGLTTALCFADMGYAVQGYDTDTLKIASLQSGILPIFEPGMQNLLVETSENGNLNFISRLGKNIHADFVFLCLPTPQLRDGSTDLSYCISALEEIMPKLKSGAILVVKSTVPVGTTNMFESTSSRSDVFFASNPEFLREGNALYDFFNPDRVVIGSSFAHVAGAVAELYSRLSCPVMLTQTTSSEMIKYAANAFLAVKLSFVNEVAELCEVVGASYDQVKSGIGSDPRIGDQFLECGPGWGGSCFPKDSISFLHGFRSKGLNGLVVEAAIKANTLAKRRIVNKLSEKLNFDLKGAKIAVWGLTFKANTDDLRESPAIEIIRDLLARGAEVTAYDPQVGYPPISGIILAHSALEAVIDAHALIVLTEWREYQQVEPQEVASRMAGEIVIDFRNVLNASQWFAKFPNFQSAGEAGNGY
jgi:UDPglucose 6-dehydrogenase